MQTGPIVQTSKRFAVMIRRTGFATASALYAGRAIGAAALLAYDVRGSASSEMEDGTVHTTRPFLLLSSQAAKKDSTPKE